MKNREAAVMNFSGLIIHLFLMIILLSSCADNFDNTTIKFRIVPSAKSGISFSNQIVENDSMNLFDYYYIYNGSGVGVGDLNNDGLPDLYFGGNMVSSKLYLNEGKFKFRDVTEVSGTSTHQWVMGVSLIDINSDGLSDIYLNIGGKGLKDSASGNLLYINKGTNTSGTPVFTESSIEYGIHDTSFSVHSTFLDHDKDGDLDLFILTNRIDLIDKTRIYPKDQSVTNGETIDRFYENMGIIDSLGHPYFIEKSEEAGIVHEGYGLGVAVDDLNGDGWPDIYVSNDFMPNDRLYINLKNGKFKDYSGSYLKHQSYNGMGMDIADINNDLLPDVMVLDMLPDNNDRRKSMIPGMHPNKFNIRYEHGYTPQYVRNTLQLNRGTDKFGTVYFSEIGQLLGIHATDWSWGPLMADFDNDGDRDIFITNGFVKDMTDMDYINYDRMNSYFGIKQVRQAKSRELMNALTEVKIPNFLYQNNGKLEFKDISLNSGIAIPSFSNGAIYSDLDADGDLDIVTNDINGEALVYENTSDGNNYVGIDLEGSGQNPDGLDSKIYINHATGQQYAYVSPSRGYLSSIKEHIHFGLGSDSIIDAIRIEWPDGSTQIEKDVKANQIINIYKKPGEGFFQVPEKQVKPYYRLLSENVIEYNHIENKYNDFKSHPLLIKMYSKGGPGISIGNIDQDNDEDIFIGGSAGNRGYFLVQGNNGKFYESFLPEDEEKYEDMASLLFDYDNDGDNDLYVVSGGSEFNSGSLNYQDRLYTNDGNGSFKRSGKLPQVISSGSCVAGADYDRDGDIDLFVGGRYSPENYPSSPKSYLLENIDSEFYDKTESAIGLQYVGMVSSAIWSDYDNDGWIDLLLVGEWMPLTVFKNTNGKLRRMNYEALSNSAGWWNVIKGGDFDKDGDTDYIVGNLGVNQDYKASLGKPFTLIANDFDKNGSTDPIFGSYIKDIAGGDMKLFPFHGLEDLSNQILAYKKVFKSYQAYSEATFDDVLAANLKEGATHYSAFTFSSTHFINLGDGKFDIKELPVNAQFAPIFSLIFEDVNEDGNLDIVGAGNTNASENTYGWHDASLGICLLGDGNNNFVPVSPPKSGLFLNDYVKSLVNIYTVNNEKLLIAGINSNDLIIHKQIEREDKIRLIKVDPYDACAEIIYRNGQKSKYEFYYGGSYISQQTRILEVTPKMDKISIFKFDGTERLISVDDLLVDL